MINISNIFRTVFQSSCTIFHSKQQYVQISILYVLTNTHYYDFLIIVIPVGAKWSVTVVLICIALVTDEVQGLLMCFWTVAYLLWRKVYSNHLLSKLAYLFPTVS